jgi:hypothetical protein
MGNRTFLAAALLLAGTLCIGVAVISAAWLDAVYAHENTALNQAAVQIQLQGKVLSEWVTNPSVLSPVFIWSGFGVGATLILAGFVVGLLAVSIRQVART